MHAVFEIECPRDGRQVVTGRELSGLDSGVQQPDEGLVESTWRGTHSSNSR